MGYIKIAPRPVTNLSSGQAPEQKNNNVGQPGNKRSYIHGADGNNSAGGGFDLSNPYTLESFDFDDMEEATDEVNTPETKNEDAADEVATLQDNRKRGDDVGDGFYDENGRYKSSKRVKLNVGQSRFSASVANKENEEPASMNSDKQPSRVSRPNVLPTSGRVQSLVLTDKALPALLSPSLPPGLEKHAGEGLNTVSPCTQQDVAKMTILPAAEVEKLRTIQVSYEDICDNHAELANENEELHNNNHQLTDDNAQLNNQNFALMRQNYDLRCENDRVKVGNQAQNNQANSVSRVTYDQLMNSHIHLNNHINTFMPQYREMEQKVKHLDSCCRDWAKREDRWNAKQHDWNTERQLFISEVKELMSSVSIMEARNNELAQTENHWRSLAYQHNSQANGLAAQYQSLQISYNQVVQEVQALKAEIGRLQKTQAGPQMYRYPPL